MYADALLYLSGAALGGNSTSFAAQSPLPVAGTPVISTNVIDMGTARDPGEGQSLFVRMQVLTAYTLLTTLTVEAILSSDSASTANIVVVGSTTIPLASLVANSRFVFVINPLLANKGQRFLAVRYITVGATPGAGSVVTDVGTDYQDGQTFYSTGIAVI